MNDFTQVSYLQHVVSLLGKVFISFYQSMHFIFWQISAFEEPLKHAPLVMLDANITQEAIDHACSFCAANHIPGKK